MILPKWQYITQGNTPSVHIGLARKVLEAGCPWIQLRMKDADAKEILAVAKELRELTSVYNALLFINDHVGIALESKADGVHLGQNDMHPTEAKNILGDDFIIGGTANTLGHIRALAEANVDYIGLGPYRFTSTKKKLSPVLGLNGYESIIKSMRQIDIHLPVYAIGGIQTKDISPILGTGVYGIALSGLLANSKEIPQTALQIQAQFKTNQKTVQ